MIELDIPGRGLIGLRHLVCDVNGTLAVDGRLVDGVPASLESLAGRLEIHLLTADTHGAQAAIDERLRLTAVRVPPGGEAESKALFVRRLGSGMVVAVGNGANDAAMLYEAAVGIAVLSPEGLASDAAAAADLIVPDILSAFHLLERPRRIVASLRR